MIPPISIDGTDITGATIDGTDVTEITVDGQTVFTAGPPIIVDDFESGNLNIWEGDTGSSNIVSTSKVGSFAVQLGINDSIGTQTGIDKIVETDDTFSIWAKMSSSSTRAVIQYNADSPSPSFGPDGYSIRLFTNSDTLTLAKRVNGSFIGLDTVSVNYSDQWYRVEGKHQSNGDINVELYDENGNIVASVSANDTELLTNGTFDGNYSKIADGGLPGGGAITPIFDHWIIL